MACCETPPPVERFDFSISPPPPPRRQSICIRSNIVHGHFDLPDLYTLKDNDRASNINRVTPISLKPRALIPRRRLPEDILTILSSCSMHHTDATTESLMIPTLGRRSLPFKFSQDTPPRKRIKLMYHIVPEGVNDTLKTVPLPAICKPTPIRAIARSA